MCVYLYGFLLFKNWGEVWENKADVFLLSAFLSDEQHIWKDEWNHVRIHKLRRERREDSVYHHSLKTEKQNPVRYT